MLDKKNILLFFVLIGTIFIRAQVEFQSYVNKNPVSVDDYFTFTIDIKNANSGEVESPDLSNFDILSGPNQSRSTSIINGAVSSQTKFSYRLRSQKTGTFVIPAINMTFKGKDYSTKEIKMEVVEGESQSANNSSPSGENQTTTTNIPKNKDVFIVPQVSKYKVYQGEPVVLTYKLFYRKNIESLGDYEAPKLNGFYVYDLELSDKQQPKQEILNGMTYNTYKIAQKLLFPQEYGKLKIDAIEVSASVRFGFFNSRKEKIKSQSAQITVLPLPQGKPADFTGGVGKLNFKVKIDKRATKANDPVTLKIKISGKGNLKLINQPKVDFPADLEVYDPSVNQKVTTNASGQKGHIEYEYLIIPRYGGNYTLPPLSFSYFDIGSKTYKTINSEQITLSVEKGEGDTQSPTLSGINKKEIELLGDDIRFIETETKLRKKDDYFFGSFGYFLSLGSPVVAFLLFFFFRKRILNNTEDTQDNRKRKANKLAQKRLAGAKQALNSSDEGAFYEAIFKALNGYLSDKFSIPVSELSRSNIEQKLTESNYESSIIEQLNETLNLCEMAKYAPVSNTSKDEVYQNTIELIGNIEKG